MSRGRGDLHHRAGNRDAAHRQQVAERKMQADAEHQEDHADLGELGRQRLVGDEARRPRADHHAGEQIADLTSGGRPGGLRDEPKTNGRVDEGPGQSVAIKGVWCGIGVSRRKDWRLLMPTQIAAISRALRRTLLCRHNDRVPPARRDHNLQPRVRRAHGRRQGCRGVYRAALGGPGNRCGGERNALAERSS